MSELHHPKALLFTAEGTFVVAPRHDVETCDGGTENGVRPVCPGCLYHHLVDELLGLVEVNVKVIPPDPKGKTHERN